MTVTNKGGKHFVSSFLSTFFLKDFWRSTARKLRNGINGVRGKKFLRFGQNDDGQILMEFSERVLDK